ncbi:hypothetical protein [Myroides odoratimimus]|uniref:Lipoprotein n=1 Tax=Myroides odoratimimus CIP 101113 TaxID=883154 RepID=A0AAV3F2L2_9FLAO|nr:hypothetical protein [Myroides odoratimimus]EHO11700.1 hypothetical protein HMPREF9715_02049 [Myroides odoratimimus CIP 101113]
MKFYYLLPLLILLTSCSSTKALNGKYRSHKVELGFFITELNFKNENDFMYKFSGDLEHTELIGTYKIVDKNVYLKFNKEKGQIESENDSLTTVEILTGNYHNYDLKNESNIDYHLKYKIRGNKLFSYRIDNGKLVTKSKYYTNTKKFLLFGSKWKSKKSYLKKIN